MHLKSVACLPGVSALAYVGATASDLSPEFSEDVEAVLDILETHSMRRAEIDRENLRARTLATARGAVNAADTYNAIRRAVGALADSHSMFLAAEDTKALQGAAHRGCISQRLSGCATSTMREEQANRLPGQAVSTGLHANRPELTTFPP